MHACLDSRSCTISHSSSSTTFTVCISFPIPPFQSFPPMYPYYRFQDLYGSTRFPATRHTRSVRALAASSRGSGSREQVVCVYVSRVFNGTNPLCHEPTNVKCETALSSRIHRPYHLPAPSLNPRAPAQHPHSPSEIPTSPQTKLIS